MTPDKDPARPKKNLDGDETVTIEVSRKKIDEIKRKAKEVYDLAVSIFPPHPGPPPGGGDEGDV